MDDIDRQFPYPRYLKVPFIFWADGTPEPPEWAQFERDYPGWVVFRGWFVPEQPAARPSQIRRGKLETRTGSSTRDVSSQIWIRATLPTLMATVLP